MKETKQEGNRRRQSKPPSICSDTRLRMANSEGRKGGMNFHPRQLQREWKPKDGSTFETLNRGLDDVKTFLENDYASRIRKDKGSFSDPQRPEVW